MSAEFLFAEIGIVDALEFYEECKKKLKSMAKDNTNRRAFVGTDSGGRDLMYAGDIPLTKFVAT
jgi:hypothetical protein